MKTLTVYINAPFGHHSQLFSGLEILKKENKIQLKYQLETKPLPKHCIRVLYNDTYLLFDLGDSLRFKNELLDQCDFYIKRMLLKSDFVSNSKLLPYGLNYSVLYPNPFLKSLFLKEKKYLKQSLKYFRNVSRLLGMNDCLAVNNLTQMECGIEDQKKIIFRSRLWDPDRNKTDWKKAERFSINNERIEVIRELSKKYQSLFIGGIVEDYLSEKLCKDITISKREAHKLSYLNELKESAIGISNPGLEKSIGWKLAEYISHSMAIVSNPLEEYKLLGNLIEGVHYLSYQSVEECLDKVNYLVNEQTACLSMRRANAQYYQEYLRPDRKIEHLLNIVDTKINQSESSHLKQISI